MSFYSITDYTGDGTTATYSVPFPYLATTDVKVYVGGVLKTVNSDYTWPNAGQITLGSAPASGAAIRFQRITPHAVQAVVFANGSNLIAADLNGADLQLLYVIQELIDLMSEMLVGLNGATVGVRWNTDTGTLQTKTATITATSVVVADWADIAATYYDLP